MEIWGPRGPYNPREMAGLGPEIALPQGKSSWGKKANNQYQTLVLLSYTLAQISYPMRDFINPRAHHASFFHWKIGTTQGKQSSCSVPSL